MALLGALAWIVCRVQRAPGIYDTAWHGAESNPQLYCDSAKSIIHCGDDEASPNWDAGFPLEINFDQAFYTVKSGDNFSGTITYEGDPVSSDFYESYWAWDAHNSPDVLRGTTLPTTRRVAIVSPMMFLTLSTTEAMIPEEAAGRVTLLIVCQWVAQPPIENIIYLK